MNPGATEVCNGIDDNCDGNIDEGVTLTFYADVDGDGFGDAASSIQACSAPAGYVADNSDCDDSNAAINPNAVEVCDGVDNNCDGTIDENCGTDADGDGVTIEDGDCNDNDPNVFPGATEICNGIDDNCDGNIDEGVTLTFYVDLDDDGFGDPTNSVQNCNAPAGYVVNNTDCDDSNAAVNPAATEILYNGIDDDCDPSTPDSDDDDDCEDDISGNLNINPSMSSNNMFIMETSDETIDMNTLSDEGSDYTYSGSATSVKIKAKGRGKTLTINGVDYILSPSKRYEFTGDLTVSLANSKGGSWRKAKGHWWLYIDGDNICITPEIETNNGNAVPDPNSTTPVTASYDNINSITAVEIPMIDFIEPYPNPFVKHVNISFTLYQDKPIELFVFDPFGKLIKHISSQDYLKGNHVLKWNGTNDSGEKVSSGLYIIRINVEDKSKTFRVLVNK